MMKKIQQKNIVKNGLFSIFAPISNMAAPIQFKNPLTKVESISDLIAVILEFVTKVGAMIVVFMVIYSGFLFVKAQGDPKQIDEAKKTFFWTVVGGLILLGAKVLAEVIKSTAREFGVVV